MPWLETVVQQMGYLVSQHTGLARPCAGYDDRGAVDMLYSPTLTVIQCFEYAFLHVFFSVLSFLFPVHATRRCRGVIVLTLLWKGRNVPHFMLYT